MTLFEGSVLEPIPISMVAGRYLLFDVNAVTYLRKTYNICGVLIGSIPQIPQQNIFLGLPVELLPEEVRILVEKKVACIVDAAAWHKGKLSTPSGIERKKYLESLRSRGRIAQTTAEENSHKRAERGLAKQAVLRASKESTPLTATNLSAPTSVCNATLAQGEDDDLVLFEIETKTSAAASATQPFSKSGSYRITPTSTYNSLLVPNDPIPDPDPLVPTSFPLFTHLHSQSYFVAPGLRFGCDYTVYPGDPLRFHSHFLAVGYEWEEEISLMDLIGGGRLGTGVKKGFLIGGRGSTVAADGGLGVRTFCIEWGGM